MTGRTCDRNVLNTNIKNKDQLNAFASKKTIVSNFSFLVEEFKTVQLSGIDEGKVNLNFLYLLLRYKL